tara:strand:- start:249 stop:431 length:183 start_codon:yes stop_codon:yes gene_type:complete
MQVAQFACLTLPEKPVPAPEAGVSPNVIRAERSEQEVAATTYNPEPGFLYPFGTAGQAGL